MARCLVYVRCRYCSSQYSGEHDEIHVEGCPRPLERRIEEFRMKVRIQTCPLCKGEAHVNDGDCFECVECHAHWIPSWTQGVEAIKASTVIFQMEDGPYHMTQLSGKGSGIFPGRDALAGSEKELEAMKASFLKKAK